MGKLHQKTTMGLNDDDGAPVLEVTVQFSTRGLEQRGVALRKHAWSSGVVSIKPSKTRGIRASTPRRFKMGPRTVSCSGAATNR
jgi:hypothetical protein